MRGWGEMWEETVPEGWTEGAHSVIVLWKRPEGGWHASRPDGPRTQRQAFWREKT